MICFAVELHQRGLRDVKIERALRLNTEGCISCTAAARLAGIHQSDFVRHAYARGMQPPFSEQTFAEELEYVHTPKKLGNNCYNLQFDL
jgi:hypothetical protein